ncbi:MAG: glycogen synthase GlgA [Actinobacteria bacterium]|nr:glycogen synthase GlgA [Actinomycetota bacterium]
MLKVAICSTEGFPFAKTGGLADVVGALPLSFKKINIEPVVIMPGYNFIFEKYKDITKILDNLKIRINRNYFEYCDVFKINYSGVNFYFIKNDKFFNRDYLYGTPQGDYSDNNLRFGFLSKAVLALLENIKFSPDIIHLHDYHVALTSVLINEKKLKKQDSFFKNTHVVFTIHNLAYQGIYDANTLDLLELDKSYFDMDKLEFYGKINFMKGGIVFSEKITTVSPTYSKEILTPEFGYGLDGILRVRQKDLSGIINGIDYEIWNPQNDKSIASNYNINKLDGKEICKKALLNNLFNNPDYNAPVLGMVSRLSEQKGIDILIEIFDVLMQKNIYLIILGTGDEKYMKQLNELYLKYRQKFSLNIAFSDKLAREIYSGADIFLMPSKYEPCGLGQLISLKYGTIPVVRNTGGLADTIAEIKLPDNINEGGQGFKFSEYSGKALLQAIKNTLNFYNDNNLWTKIIKNAMNCDFSWDYSAKQYKEIFLKLI